MKYNASNIPLKVGDIILTVGTTRKIKSLDTSIRFECGGSITFNTIAMHDNYIAYRPSDDTWFIPCVKAGVPVSKEQELKLRSLVQKYRTTYILQPKNSDHVSDAISYATGLAGSTVVYENIINANPCKEINLPNSTGLVIFDYRINVGVPSSNQKDTLYMSTVTGRISSITESQSNSPKGKIEMNENNTVRKMVMVRNIDILTATPDTLISVITAIHRDIEKLEDVPVASKYVESEIAKLQKVMKKVVKQLDSRAS